MWRVHPADMHRVPPDDCPESWGRRDEWLRQVREQRLREAVMIGGGGLGGDAGARRGPVVSRELIGRLVGLGVLAALVWWF